jgi:DNA-binding NarL/FixJ family response regulator
MSSDPWILRRVDDHPIVLAGLSALIESDNGLELVAAARSAATRSR